MACDIDKEQLEELMRLRPTLLDTAAVMKCSESTISRYIRETFDLTFEAFREQRMAFTRQRLVKKALEMAEKGDRTMLIFCLKNLCGWADKSESEIKASQQVHVTQEQVTEVMNQIKLLKNAG